jgi:hypothetical protein
MSDRTVHAKMGQPGFEIELVRYDRQGRWYVETWTGRVWHRDRVATVHDAAQAALDMEDKGGTIHEGRPGGKQFDSKVAGARQRRSRGVRR